MPKTNNDKRIEKIIDVGYPDFKEDQVTFQIDSLREILTDLIQQAREEEKKEIVKILKEKVKNQRTYVLKEGHLITKQTTINIINKLNLIQDK